ncbi:MAG: hypothetical protein GSR85_04800 [Desulfurococcales archaeon]|nr:hypothetical protein [Desulfurococcales archaeon]
MSVGEDGIYDIDASKIHSTVKMDKTATVKARSSRIIRISADPDIVVFLGRERDHVLIDSHYCSCTAFTISTGSGELKGCSHIGALEVAVREGLILDISSSISKGEMDRVIWEVLTGEFTMTLRRILHKKHTTR